MISFNEEKVWITTLFFFRKKSGIRAIKPKHR